MRNDLLNYVGFGDGESLLVYDKYAIEQADNGENADARETLMLAPIAGENKGECLYIETNGDPLVIAIREHDEEEWQLNIARFVGTDRTIVDLGLEEFGWIRDFLDEADIVASA